MTLLSVSFFYLIAGSAGFFRRKLDPHTDKPEFDYCFRVLFRAGLALFTLGLFEWAFPSDYWLIGLIVTLGLMIHLIFRQLDRLMKPQSETEKRN